MPGWVLIVEAVLFGLPTLAAVPLWGLVPMVFGVTPTTPPGPANRVYLLLVLFPLTLIGSLTTAWLAEPDDPLRWLAIVPPLHFAILILARVRRPLPKDDPS